MHAVRDQCGLGVMVWNGMLFYGLSIVEGRRVVSRATGLGVFVALAGVAVLSTALRLASALVFVPGA